MTKKQQFIYSAPWRGGEEQQEKDFPDTKLKVTKHPGSTTTMHVPRKKSVKSKRSNDEGDDSLTEIDPELRYNFQRSYQFLQRVFSIDAIVKRLPPAPAYNVPRSLNFFARIFEVFL